MKNGLVVNRTAVFKTPLNDYFRRLCCLQSMATTILFVYELLRMIFSSSECFPTAKGTQTNFHRCCSNPYADFVRNV